MKTALKHIAYIALITLLFYSCSVTKYIPEGERLYTGATIEIKADSTVKDVDVLKAELEGVLRPEPNSKFLGMRPGLYYYFKTQKEKPGFINRWIYKQIGEKPVYQSSVEPFEVEEILRDRLENHGFFYSTTASSFQEEDI